MDGKEGGKEEDELKLYKAFHPTVHTFQSHIQIRTSKNGEESSQNLASSGNPVISFKMKKYIEVINNALQKNIKTAYFNLTKLTWPGGGGVSAKMNHLFKAGEKARLD